MKSIYYNIDLEEKNNRKWFKNVKLIGEIDEGTSIYIEDYAYTYLKQYANSDLSYELCAVLIGEYNKESNQVIVYGIIPVDVKLLDKDTQWIGENVLGAIEDERKCYFPEGEYVGWMHTQPGYGIVASTKEMAVHKEMFGVDCIMILIDPLDHTEVFFTCHEDEFKANKGFCIYYEKNEQMQKYMEDHFISGKKERGGSDKVVDDFRKLGAKWKREAERRRSRNRIASITVVGVILTIVLALGIQSQQKKINKLENEINSINHQYSEIEKAMVFNGYH